ncbi:MAG: type II toxin-antitoxin system RelE/ParE family toxin [Prochlorococcaceae cyanobacterium]
MPIQSYGCKHTASILKGGSPLRFNSILLAAERKLVILDAASCLDDLRVPPGNRLEKLHGDREGQ